MIMKLIQTKKDDFSITQSFDHLLHVNGKNGTIELNSPFLEYHKLKVGDPVKFYYDKETSPPDFYLAIPPSVSADETSFELKQNKASKRLKFQCAGLAREMTIGILKKKDPHKKDNEFDTKIRVRFTISKKPALDGDTEVPDTYAILGGGNLIGCSVCAWPVGYSNVGVLPGRLFLILKNSFMKFSLFRIIILKVQIARLHRQQRRALRKIGLHIYTLRWMAISKAKGFTHNNRQVYWVTKEEIGYFVLNMEDIQRFNNANMKHRGGTRHKASDFDKTCIWRSPNYSALIG